MEKEDCGIVLLYHWIYLCYMGHITYIPQVSMVLIYIIYQWDRIYTFIYEEDVVV